MNLAVRYQQRRADHPKARARDLAAGLGVSEAQLLEAGCGARATRLRPEWPALLGALEALGEVMALTRNEAAVHEKIGVWRGLSMRGPHGIVYGGPIDLRLFPSSWASAFAVEVDGPKGLRRSLQIFDRHGVAVHKVHLREASDLDAWAALVARFAAPDLEPLAPEPLPDPALSAEHVDVEALLEGWTRLQDSHDFFGLLRVQSVTRPDAMRLAEGRFTRRVAADVTEAALTAAAEQALPIMVFVGNRGCIQIHCGPVARIKRLGEWVNVLDPGFNLHLNEGHVAEAWVVFKPTRFGGVSSLELYDAQGEVIAQLFSLRDGEEAPEREAWRGLLAAL